MQPFIWESSGAESILHSLSVRLRKRLAQGLQVGGTYTYSKSMDNASSLGGGGGTVAQNDKDLAAEWGPSSFDVRHRFAADFSVELPFGQNRRWLNKEGGRRPDLRRLDAERHVSRSRPGSRSRRA